MRVPLSYQATCFGCGPTSLVNALSFLFEREELDPQLVRHIYATTLDRHHGPACPGGTSRHAMSYVAHWLNDHAKATALPVEALHLRGDEVTFAAGSRALAWVRAGGVAVISCWLGVDHYVLVTGIDVDGAGAPTQARLFDPWYDTAAQAFAADGLLAGADPADVRFVGDAPLSHNRIVAARLLMSPKRGPYSLVCDTPREMTLLRRTDKALL